MMLSSFRLTIFPLLFSLVRSDEAGTLIVGGVRAEDKEFPYYVHGKSASLGNNAEPAYWHLISSLALLLSTKRYIWRVMWCFLDSSRYCYDGSPLPRRIQPIRRNWVKRLVREGRGPSHRHQQVDSSSFLHSRARMERYYAYETCFTEFCAIGKAKLG